MRIRVNAPPCACQRTPPSKEETWPPLQTPPPLERRNTARAIDKGGGWYASRHVPHTGPCSAHCAHWCLDYNLLSNL